MKITVALAMFVCCWCTLAWGAIAGNGPPSVAADGFIQFKPPQLHGCVAVRVRVPDDKMVTGIRWYNGSATEAFPRVLVASGTRLFPPPFDESVVMADSVNGLEGQWSTVMFVNPIASTSGALFFEMEYPANYAPPASSAALGVGYAQQDASHPYFVTGDGETWTEVAARCRVLLEPVLEDRLPGVFELNQAQMGESSVPPVARTGLFVAPNPFNPQTKIELSLAGAATGDLRVYDVRGRLVIELFRGAFAQGANMFVWNGRDAQGRGVSSGAYWVQARTDDRLLTQKVLLLK